MLANRDYLFKAFRLAYFIHQDTEVAADIARRALAKLEVAANAQFKRYYYKPTGRSQKNSAQAHRTKVILRESHLLQRLVYIESEVIEQQHEKNHAEDLTRSDMVTRFVKHLVKLTLRRNSFYITLGVSRLLHNYSTSDTMELYALVIQDPERVPDDFYYRSRKKRLMQEFRTRFGDFLKIVKGYRGEQRFQEEDAPGRLMEVVRECLQRFTPWDSTCIITERFDPYAQEVTGLAFDSEDPDAEHNIELNRIHTVLHPDCYARLTSSLELSKPEERLAIPHFNLHEEEKEEDDDGDQRRDPPDLEDDAVAKIFRHLTEQKSARQQKVPEVLSIRIDGCDVATLDPVRQRAIHMTATDEAEMIEVYAPDDILLAVYLITDPDPLEPKAALTEKIVLEAGQEVSFTILARPDADGLGATLDIAVGYRETQPARRLSLFGSKVKRGLMSALGIGAGSPIPVWAPVLAILLLALLLFRGGLPFNGPDPDIDNGLRGLQFSHYGQPLSQVSAIYVDPIGENDFSLRLRQALIEKLTSSQRFHIPDKRDDADAVFKNLSAFIDTPKHDIVLALVNANGDTLWTVTGLMEAKKPDPNLQADKILEALVEEIEKQ